MNFLKSSTEPSESFLTMVKIFHLFTGLRIISVILLHFHDIADSLIKLWNMFISISSKQIQFRDVILHIIYALISFNKLIGPDHFDALATISRITFVIPVTLLQLYIGLIFTLSRLCLHCISQTVDNFSKLQEKNIFILYSDEPCIRSAWGSLDNSVDKLKEIHLEVYLNIKKLNDYFSDSLLFVTLGCRIGAFTDLYFYTLNKQFFLLRFTVTNIFILEAICIICSRYTAMEEKLKNALSQMDFRVFGETKKLEVMMDGEELTGVNVDPKLTDTFCTVGAESTDKTKPKSSDKKRRDLSLNEKIAILNDYDKLPKMSQRNAAAQLKISQPLLCKILRTRQSIEEQAKNHKNPCLKRNRSGKDGKVESALKKWFTSFREQDSSSCVDGKQMRKKAEDFAKLMGKEDFIATEGWFHRWKKRENIVYKRSHGKEKDKTDEKISGYWIENEWNNICMEFTTDNIYTADETILFFRALPHHTTLFQTQNSNGDPIIIENKNIKDRFTILTCSNMSGDKNKLLLIGKHCPVYLTKVKQLPVQYYYNTNAWMTPVIFNEWLVNWDNSLNHKIALIVDYSITHRVTANLNFIKVIYLPSNSQHDQGVVKTLKSYYRKELRFRILQQVEDQVSMDDKILDNIGQNNKLNDNIGVENQQNHLNTGNRILENYQKKIADNLVTKMNLLDIIHLIAAAWNKITKKTVINHLKHQGFLADIIEEEELNLLPPDMSSTEFEEWMSIDDNLNLSELTEKEICESLMFYKEEDDSKMKEEKDEEAPSVSEVSSAVEILRKFVYYNADAFHSQYQYEDYIYSLISQNR